MILKVFKQIPRFSKIETFPKRFLISIEDPCNQPQGVVELTVHQRIESENVINPKGSVTKKKEGAKRRSSKTAMGPDPSNKQDKPRFEQIIFRDWCKSCGICSAFCPKKVIGRDESGAPVIEDPDACIGCRFCELHCPDFAITVRERQETE